MAAPVMKLVLLLLSITSHQVVAAQQKHAIDVQSLLSGATCSSAPAAPDAATTASHPGTTGSSRTLQIVRRECLQTGDHETASEHYTAILRRDHYRVRSIHRRLAGQQSDTTTIPARLGLPFQSLEYVVTVGIGTPPQNFTVLFDTGSDLTWVHCLPCADACHAQKDPLFNPGASSTYSNIPCSSPGCQIHGGQQTSCGPRSCEYHVKYGDGSETFGNLANETITLTPAAPPAAGIVFGCSERSNGFDHTMVAGLLGLGRGDSSILSQTRRASDGDGGRVVFSYCLPRRGSSTGYLTLGAAAPQSSTNVSFTPLRTGGDPALSSLYMVDLASISVNGAAVRIPTGAFSMGAFVDSGTVVTHMPADAYIPLRDEFRRHMGGYKMLPEGSVQFLDTCYDVTGHDVVTVPRVAFVFGGGATMDVDASGILYVVGGDGAAVACLAFIPTSTSVGLAVIGNMQQRGHNVVFDVAGGRVGFGPNGCS